MPIRSARPFHRFWLQASLLAGLTAAFLASCGESLGPPPAPFRQISFDEAVAEAGREGKAVFIDFYASWCPPCRRLAAATWPDPAVQEWLDTHTVPLKIDAEREVRLAGRFGVEAYPTLIFIDGEGQEIGRLLGFRDPAGFIAEGSRILGGRQQPPAEN